MALAAALVTFAVWGEVRRKTTATGLLQPDLGLLSVATPQRGVLVESRFTEGERVEAGAVLFALDTSHRSIGGETAVLVARQIEARAATLEAEESLRQSQAQQRRQSLKDRLQNFEREIAQQAEEIDLQARRVALARRTLERHQQLAKEGFVAEAQVQAKQEEWMDSHARLQSLRRQRLALQRDAEWVRVESAQIGNQLEAEIGQLRRNRASLHQEDAENAGRQKLLITAPQTGLITALHMQLGQVAPAGQALATLIPEGAKLEAQLWLPSRKAGFVETGQQIFLRYAAYPYQKFGMHPAVVVDVARTPSSGDELPKGLAAQLLDQADAKEALYRVRARPHSTSLVAFGKSHALKSGLTVEAEILLDQRAVWEWVFEPALAIAAKAKAFTANERSYQTANGEE